MAATYLRKATLEDLPAIINVINDAKTHLHAQGVDQWQNGYPDDDQMRDDVENGYTYVLMFGNDVAGTATLFPSPDENYSGIDQGEWVGNPDGPYTVIHRIAISSDFRGQHLSRIMISNLISLSIEKGYDDVRIDTHPDNKGMQHVIASNGFTYRGLIYMFADRQPRFAYQLLINDDNE